MRNRVWLAAGIVVVLIALAVLATLSLGARRPIVVYERRDTREVAELRQKLELEKARNAQLTESLNAAQMQTPREEIEKFDSEMSVSGTYGATAPATAPSPAPELISPAPSPAPVPTPVPAPALAPPLAAAEKPLPSIAGVIPPNKQHVIADAACDANKPCPIRVFYATDRNVVQPARRRGLPPTETAYGGGREKEYDSDKKQKDPLHYGSCIVSIPADHNAGTMEGPRHFQEWTLDRDLTVVHVFEAKDFNSFRSQVNARLRQADSRDIFVFIHGYNVTFEDAARRTAQMYWDLDFKGAPIFYSWPSKGSVVRYAADEASAAWTTRHLMKFLEDLSTSTDARRIHLIAHSMGNRPLTEALARIAEKRSAVEQSGAGACKVESAPPAKFSQIVLAAPDMDRDTFVQLRDDLEKETDHITVYASRRDRTIVASWMIHFFRRLGVPTGSASDFCDEKVTAVDATKGSTGLLGHSYYGASVLWDIADILDCDDTATKSRGMSESRGYYLFVPRGDPPPWILKKLWLRLIHQLPIDVIHPSCWVNGVGSSRTATTAEGSINH